MYMRGLRPALLRMAGVGLAYYAGAWVGVTQTITPEGIAILWPPNAVLLAAFLLFPYRHWGSVGLAALGAELVADLPHFPLWASLAFGLVNVYEASVAAWLIRRFAPEPFDFQRLRNAVRFLLFGPVLASATAALAGAAVYVLLGRSETGYLALWRLWWFGDALGLLLLTPLIIAVWRFVEQGAAPSWSWPRMLEALALAGTLVLLGTTVFVQGPPESLTFHVTPILLVPMGVWAAVRFGVLGATLAVAGIAAMAVGHLVRGVYPYPNVTPEHAAWLTQEYLAVVAVVSVGLAVLLREMDRQRTILRRQDDELRTQNVRLEEGIEARTADLEQANRSLEDANTTLARLATTDFLTGFANRRHFEELAQRELRRLTREGARASLLMFDLDRFKAINDEHGHGVGDEVLRQLADPIRRSLRPRDLHGRIGGEEFVVLLSYTDHTHACKIAERLRAHIAEHVVEHRGVSIRTTASVGVANWTGQERLDALIRRADEALYRAKAAGRDRVAC